MTRAEIIKALENIGRKEEMKDKISNGVVKRGIVVHTDGKLVRCFTWKI